MKKTPHIALCLAPFLLGCMAVSAPAAELVSIKNATLVEADLNDGDSFKVRAGGRELHLRLYYVDCPETTYASNAELERIREQQRHFGLEDPADIADFGEQAAEHIRQTLSRPFTIHTSYARAPGRSAAGRYYAFIETHDGRDLGHILIERGLARIHGKTRPSPDGTPSATVLAELQDLRATAMLKRAGVWRATNPDLLAKLREQQREDDREMEEFRTSVSPTRTPNDPPLDLNTASNKQLRKIPRIGPVTAAKIIAGRPYRSVDDLLKIPGIGPKTLEAIAPHVRIGSQ